MSAPHFPKAHGKGDLNANDVQKIEENLAGEDHSAVPSMPILHLIYLIRKAELPAGKTDDWSDMVDDELKHLKAAVKLLKNDDALAYKYGRTMQGAMELVGLLKARAASKDIEDRIDGVVATDLVATSRNHAFKKYVSGIKPPVGGSSSGGGTIKL